MSSNVFDLATFPVHLDKAVGASVEPEFDGGMDWYQAYAERHGETGRLVAIHQMSGKWTSWEVHPAGAELVIVTHGSMTLIQEIDGKTRRLELSAGQAAINPPGVWHTADIDDTATVLFITAGAGTQHRPREDSP